MRQGSAGVSGVAEAGVACGCGFLIALTGLTCLYLGHVQDSNQIFSDSVVRFVPPPSPGVQNGSLPSANGEVPTLAPAGGTATLDDPVHPLPIPFASLATSPGQNASAFELISLRDFPDEVKRTGPNSKTNWTAGNSVAGPVLPPGATGWSGLKLFIFSGNEHLSARVRKDRAWQYGMLAWWCRTLRAVEDGHFVDVGGNIGSYAIPIGCCIRGGMCSGAPGTIPQRRVITAEMDPNTRRVLEANVQINGLDNMDIFPFAVGDPNEVGPIGIDEHANANNAGAHEVSTRLRKGKPSALLTTFDKMLEAMPATMGAVLGMVLDVEHHEWKAFQGATRFFKESPPCWLQVEMPNGKGSVQRFHDLLSGYGYTKGKHIAFAGVTDEMYEQIALKDCVSRTVQSAALLRTTKR